jgi:hypothetical protein
MLFVNTRGTPGPCCAQHRVNSDAFVADAACAAAAATVLQAVLRLAIQERRVLCATLHVDVSNSAALGLYRQAGFVEVRLLSTQQSACCSDDTHSVVWCQCCAFPQVSLLSTSRCTNSASTDVMQSCHGGHLG